MPEFPRKNSSPTSWKDQAIEQAIEQFKESLPEERTQQIISAELARLKGELINIKNFERHDRHNLFPVTKKENYQTIDILTGHSSPILAIHVLPDGSIISGSIDETIRIWTKTPMNGWESQVLTGHTAKVFCIQGIPGNKILSGGGDGNIRLWTRDSSGEWQNEIIHEPSSVVTCLQVFPSGAIVSGNLDGKLLFGSQNSGGQWDFSEIGVQGNRVDCIHGISEHSFFSGDNNGALRFWQKSPSGEWTRQTMVEHDGPIHDIQALSNEQAISCGAAPIVQFWSRDSKLQWQPYKSISEPTQREICLHALLDGRIVSGGQGGDISIRSKAADGQWRTEKLKGHNQAVSNLQVLPSGKIVSGSWDKTIRIWDGEEVT